MSQFNITRQKVSLKRATSSHTVNKNTSENNNYDDLMHHAINKNRNEYYNLRRSNNYSNHIGLKTGTYYIECSPVNDDDNSLKRAVKMKNFMMLAVSMGFAKVSNANMIDDNFRREGTILEFTVRNDEDFRYLIRKAQELANDFDDGNGFIVYRNQNNKMGHDYVTTFNAGTDEIKSLLNSQGLPSNLKCYEYSNSFNRKVTIIDSKNNDISMINAIKQLTTSSYTDIKTDVYIIRKD